MELYEKPFKEFQSKPSSEHPLYDRLLEYRSLEYIAESEMSVLAERWPAGKMLAPDEVEDILLEEDASMVRARQYVQASAACQHMERVGGRPVVKESFLTTCL